MTVTEDRPGTGEIGRARVRKEDAHLLTGRTTWTDNMTLPGMLHLAILRSPFSHARITRVDLSGARSRPGVVAAFSGADIADVQGVVPLAWPVTPDIVNPGQPPLAVDHVNYVGEAVAVVAARDKYAAQDALEAIEVDYDALPPVLDIDAAAAAGAELVHPGTTSNISFSWRFDSAEAGTGESVDTALSRSDVVVRRRLVQQRVIPAFLEPRSTVVEPNGDGVTMWTSTQIPHVLRVMLALSLGLPEHQIRVIAPDVGGGFGGKLQIPPEELLCAVIARRLDKPVKYTESRSESLLSGHHGRDQVQYLELGADRSGRLTAFNVHLLANMGAYLRLLTPSIPLLGAFMYPGIYKIPAYRLVCDGVFTTMTPTDAYRGAGRPEATFAIERMMDTLAAELSMDPMELRRMNWIRHDEFPFTTVAGLTYDTGNYEAATEKATALFDWNALRRERDERRERGDSVQLGLGISTYTEMCGLAPSRWLGEMSYAAGGWETASVRMLPTGKVEVVTGTSPHGQGHETAWSQLVSDRLGIPFEDVVVLHGDTASSPRGLDTYGSRSLPVGGIAVVKAADKVVEKARTIAAHMLEAAEADLDFVNGRFQVRGTEQGVGIQDVALATFASHSRPPGVEPGIDADATYDPDNFSFPHGTHLCAVEVDTETGAVSIRSYVCVDDIGVAVNPLIVEGQVHGGLTQGISQALFEEAVYDEAGNLSTGTLADYLIPTAADLPTFVTDRTETPSTSNPIGVKGVGEAGTIASTPAVVNAVVDALRPFGVDDVRMPMTPERVWRAIQDGRSGTRSEDRSDTRDEGGAR